MKDSNSMKEFENWLKVNAEYQKKITDKDGEILDSYISISDYQRGVIDTSRKIYELYLIHKVRSGDAKKIECETCDGEKYLYKQVEDSYLDDWVSYEPTRCPACDGKGYILD